MTFDSYLESGGYAKGSRLDPEVASQQFSLWQIATTRRPAPAQSSNDSGMLGSLGGIAGKFMGGGEGGTGFGGAAGWAGVPGGAAQGFVAGQYNYETDPRMKSGKDGFGKHYSDSRAQVGGTILGGTMGYFGLGNFAGPATLAAHQVMEPTTRWLINTGDQMGGAGGALMLDPIGTVASGKYSGKELAIGALMGPPAKWFGII
jgi:hypothetical protein